MQSLNTQQAREWCQQSATCLAVTDQDLLEYKSAQNYSFLVKIPPEHRKIVALSHDIVAYPTEQAFEGALLWLQQWQVGVNELARPGWRVLEQIRQAHGNRESLETAPATLFRQDELVEAHACLIQVMGYGWGTYFVPSSGGYFLDIRTSDRFFCVAKTPELLGTFRSYLENWKPVPA